MFRAAMCSSSGAQLYAQNFWYKHSVSGHPVYHTQSDYTRSCIHTTVLLKMSTQLLKTCRGFK